eukprot:jgi/Chlat1/2636/Chrsp178S08721
MVFGMHLHGAHSGQDAVVASAEKQTINNLQQAAVDQVAHNSIKKVTSADSDRDSGSVHLHEHSALPHADIHQPRAVLRILMLFHALLPAAVARHTSGGSLTARPVTPPPLPTSPSLPQLRPNPMPLRLQPTPATFQP